MTSQITLETYILSTKKLEPWASKTARHNFEDWICREMNSISRIKHRKEIKILKIENIFIISESSQADAVQIDAIGINDNRRYAYMYWTLKLVLWIWILLSVFPIFETLMSLNFEKN